MNNVSTPFQLTGRQIILSARTTPDEVHRVAQEALGQYDDPTPEDWCMFVLLTLMGLGITEETGLIKTTHVVDPDLQYRFIAAILTKLTGVVWRKRSVTGYEMITS